MGWRPPVYWLEHIISSDLRYDCLMSAIHDMRERERHMQRRRWREAKYWGWQGGGYNVMCAIKWPMIWSLHQDGDDDAQGTQGQERRKKTKGEGKRRN